MKRKKEEENNTDTSRRRKPGTFRKALRRIFALSPILFAAYAFKASGFADKLGRGRKGVRNG